MGKNKYKIIETVCFPNKWKVQHYMARDTNASYLFHKELKEAIYQVEECFNGEVVNVVYLEN